MDTTQIKTETPDTFEIDPEDFTITSDEIKLEFSEIGDPVPFKLITEEHEHGEPNTYRMEVPVPNAWMTDAVLNQPGPSNVDQLATDRQSSSPPPNKRLKTNLQGITKRNRRKNNESTEIMSSDDDAFSEESDMEYGEDSDNDSECEYISDDEPPRAGDHGGGRYDGDKKTEDLWWKVNRPEWTTDDSSMINIEFTKKRELFKLTPKTPYETFRWLLNDEILDTIVNETNKYAANLKKKKIAPSSRIWSWKDVTREELITFLALVLHTGTIRTNRLGDYWKGDYLFNLNCFSRFMTRNRFMLILHCLNFASPDPNNHDNVAKIRPFINHFNNVMKEIYYPGKELYIAKSMVFWHGKLVRQEYTDHRRHKNAINLFKLAEPDGTVVKFQVYAGKSSDNIVRVSTGQIVEELVADKLGCGHALYMDRYYSSYRLALTLLKEQTYCTGTLNKKSRYNPFKDGRCETSLFSKGVHVGKWRGRKSTLYITTEFKDQVHQVMENNGTVSQKPKALINFSRFMTASELQDQLMSYMPFSRKMMRWYKKVFTFALQIYMNNAFHLYNNFSGIKKKIRYYEYRMAVLKAMLPPPMHHPQSELVVSSQSSHRLSRMTRTRLRERKEKDGSVRILNEVVRKECRLCRRNKRRTATPFECLGCEGSPAFCTTCFCEAHVSTRESYTTDVDGIVHYNNF